MPQGFGDWFTSPMVPKEAIRGLQDRIDDPNSGSDGVWGARLRGFGAGALEGLRQQTSPLNLTSAVLAGTGLAEGRAASALAERAPAVTQGLSRGMAGLKGGEGGLSIAEDVVPHTQIHPSMPDVEALQGLLKSRLQEVPQATGVIRQPKPGGVLSNVLERAAEKSGLGLDPTPGEAQLMRRFMPTPGVR